MVGALVLVALVAVGYSAWRAQQVRDDLFAARDAALLLRQAVVDGDQQAADAALTELTEHSDLAREGTSGPTWRVLGVLPVVGDDAEGVKVVAEVLADLAHDGLRPLVDSDQALDVGAFAPVDGAIDVQAISAAAEPLGAAKGAFATADRRLSRLEPKGYLDPLRVAVDDLSGQVHSASYGLHAADRATDVLPQMLGADRKRTWLLIFQNPAELRSTGGLPGASALMTADAGRIEMVTQYTSFPEAPAPVLLLSAQERSMFDVQLGTYYQDANFTPDFGRTAELMAAHLRRNEQQTVDGVLSLDPVALSYLLKAMGPMTVQGLTLTPENAVDELLHKVYLRIDDPEQQNEFFAEVARRVFASVTQGAASPEQLLEGLGRAARERRLLVHSFDDAEQVKLADTVVGANLLAEVDGEPRIGVYLNDATGSKMSYFLDYDVDVRATGCRAGQQKYAGEIDLRSTAPADAAQLPVSVTGTGQYGTPLGEQLVVVHVYAPIGGEFDGVVLDGRTDEIFFDEHAGHRTASFALSFKPGERHTISFRMTSGPDKGDATDVYVTPGTSAENESSRIRSLC
ncbi:DUF4012 domain-containing protein [Nocardioides dubius]|uniref:DUF4012 domain-containing protein n=2 Tax=Nocardioides dubius TaxID=317019 RepID=UPI0039E90415